MKYEDIKLLCKKGKVGIIPGWVGYLKWNYGLNELQFVNNDYVMSLSELEDKIISKNDLYYII